MQVYTLRTLPDGRVHVSRPSRDTPEGIVTGPDARTSLPVAVLIEWHSSSLSEADAIRLAEETTAAFRRIPGLIDIRFFGDFATGTHWYLQTWESHEAHEAYMASEEMFRIRDVATPFVEGRPSRRILTDYTPASRA